VSSVVVSLLHSLRSVVQSRASLHLEIIALRHRLAVLNRSRRRRLARGYNADVCAQDVLGLASPRTRLLTCGVFRTIAGLELRCGYGEDDLIRSQYAIEIGMSRALAADWRAAAVLKGFHDSIET
jgi:hypothetical protein